MDESLITATRDRLYSAVISDVLDGLGHRDHAMASNVRPVDENLVLFGCARTALYMPVFHVEKGTNPYELEMTLIDDLKAGDVPVLACSGSERPATWGELLSTAARARGATGCVTDGFVRDVLAIRRMTFPVFASGMSPLDSKGRGTVARLDVPVECGGVLVTPGDWVFGDADGVVVIPHALADRAVPLAIEKVDGENIVRDELAAGAPLQEVFARHRIL